MTVIPLRGEKTALIDRLRATRLPPPAVRRALRRSAGARLHHVATEVGVSEASVSCWERGIYEPGPRHIEAYLQLLRDFADFARESSAEQTQK